MKKFYSKESRIGSGLDDIIVKCFSSKSGRDAYVNDHKNKATAAILRSEATKYAAEGMLPPKPYSGEHWMITDEDECDDLKATYDYIGMLYVSMKFLKEVERFYK
jgi:hypothetical protein